MGPEYYQADCAKASEPFRYEPSRLERAISIGYALINVLQAVHGLQQAAKRTR